MRFILSFCRIFSIAREAGLFLILLNFKLIRKPTYSIMKLPILTLFICLVLNVSGLCQDQFKNSQQIDATAGYSIVPLLGDYDGDGDMDILGTGMYTLNGTATNATALFRNDGGGSFVAVDIQLPSFYNGGMFQWADVDSDNDLDIVAGGCSSYCYSSKSLSIYRNDGADSFTLIQTPTNLIGGQRFSLVDFNNDGLIDIEIATQSDYDGSVIGHTFYRNGGNFIFEKTFEIPVTVGEVSWADLDNDGWVDFVLLDAVYKNLRNGTFESVEGQGMLPPFLKHVLLDADQDGDVDVVAGNGQLMTNNGLGQFSSNSVVVPYDYISCLAIADFDGDGDQDLVASGGDSQGYKLELFRSNGDATYVPEQLNEEYNYAASIAVADVDNDRDPDILIGGYFTDNVIVIQNDLKQQLSEPSTPSNLKALFGVETIIFSWDEATDPEQSKLRYNVYLTYNSNFVVAPSADLEEGTSLIPGAANAGNLQHFEISTSNLPEGYYQWSVQAVDAELNASEFTQPKEFTLYRNNPANSPNNLVPLNVGNRSVSLTWSDQSTDEVAFVIERSIESNFGFEVIAQLAPNTQNFTDQTVLSRNVYYYRVRMVRSVEIGYSNVIGVTTKPDIETVPTNLTAIALNSASAEIQWDYAAGGITGFVIERSAGDKFHFTKVDTTAADATSYVDLYLGSGRNYYYRIFAYHGGDVSGYSSIANVALPLKEFNKIDLPSLNYESSYAKGSMAWGDYDNDGFDDLLLADKAQLFHNAGNGTFNQVSEPGIHASANAYDFAAVWGDFDNDGLLDLFYYNDKDKSCIYRGHGDGTFTKVLTSVSEDISLVINATWTDYDLDGDLDLSMTGGRYIYRYDGEDTFVRVDLPGGNPTSYYHSSVASWADYDDDGDPDVFWGNKGQDELFRNNGDGTFTSITDQRVTKDYNYDCCPTETPTALWADFNNDLKLDLTVFHTAAPFYVYANHNSKLDSAFYYYNYNWNSTKNLFWTDYDNDGDLDLFAMGQYNQKTTIWENYDGGQLRKVKGGPLYDFVPTDAAFSWNDFDNDGYADLFQFDPAHQIYKNIPNGNNWIKIRLRGHFSNSTGLGAKVFVKAGADWQRSDVTTHHSYQIQQGFMTLFGVGRSTLIDSIRVIWPSGNRQYLTNLDVNQTILLDENDAQVKVIQAPSNLKADVRFPSTIILKWTDRTNDETGFLIEMSTNSGEFQEAGTVGPNTSTFQLNSLTTGVEYQFRVRSLQGGRWTNTVKAQIRLFTEASGGDLTAFHSRPDGVSWGDPDGDGDPDLFVGSSTFEPDAVYYNENGYFVRKYLTDRWSYSRQAQWVDYDNDGYQDLHISVGGGILGSTEVLNDFLYKNNKSGLLVEQTNHILAQDGRADYTAAWGDLNKDSFLEMVAAKPNGNAAVYVNLGGNLTLQEGASGLAITEGTILLADLDNDRDQDVVALGAYGNLTQHQNVDGQFHIISNSGIPNDAYFFLLEDFNNDGAHDFLMVTTQRKLKLLLFDRKTNKFVEKPNIFPSVTSAAKVSSGDFDNNGFIDVFVTGLNNYSGNSNWLLLNHEDLQFTTMKDPLLDRQLVGVAMADYNKDGSLDLVSLALDNSYEGNRYLLKGSRSENHWIRIKLKGVSSNKFGIGARIKLYYGKATQVRDMRSSTPATFCDEQVPHFGLGSTTAIDYIKIEWPSGKNQWIANPPIDTELTFEEATTPMPQPPAKPTNLIATYQSPGLIELNWNDESGDESKFRIERAVGAGSFERLREVPANVTSFTDSSFLNFTGYQLDVRYRVVSIRFDEIDSDPSNEAQLSQITGLEDRIGGLTIYPQPASSHVFIRSEHPLQCIEIVGNRGEEIKRQIADGLYEVELHLGNVNPGLYFMRISNDAGTFFKKLLVTPRN